MWGKILWHLKRGGLYPFVWGKIQDLGLKPELMNNLKFFNNPLWKALKRCLVIWMLLKVNNYSSENFWPKCRWLWCTRLYKSIVLFIIHNCIIKVPFILGAHRLTPGSSSFTAHWCLEESSQLLSPILADPGLWLWRKPQCGEESLQKNENRKCLRPWQKDTK